MKTSKLFGICIAFLLALAIVNAAPISLDNLLNGYSNAYTDGTFNVQYTGYTHTDTDYSTNAGRVNLNFTISGTGTSSQYTIITTTNAMNSSGIFMGGNLKNELNKSSPGLAVMTINGNYIYCNDPQPNTLSVDLKIYQNGILHYEDKFNPQVICRTSPVVIQDGSYIHPTNYVAGKFNSVSVDLLLGLSETRTYNIGAYITDGKSATAYSSANSGSTIVFTSDQIKDFDLKNGSIMLKAISVDGHIMDYNQSEYKGLTASITQSCPGDPIYAFNTPCVGGASIYIVGPLSNYNFSFSDMYVTSYGFNKTFAGSKIKQFGVALKSRNFNGPYNAEISLENIYGEFVGTQQTTISSSSSTTWFNGTEIYNNKVSGPYIIGSIKVTKSGQQVLHQVNKGTSQDMTYFNFTAPPMVDLKINNSDLKGNSKDLNVTVFNQGTGDASGIVITVFNSQAQKIKEIILSGINSGNNQKYKFTGINLTSGFVAVDFNNQIEELNESNNVASFSFTPPGPNNNPVITTNPSSAAIRGQTYSYDMNATDADVGDVLTYSTNSTFGSINSNGLFTWNVLNSDFGNRNIRFSVSDGKFMRNQSVIISLNSNNYTLRAGTLDYTSELFINSAINVASQTKNTTSMVNFTVNSNTPLTITHSASAHLTDSDYIYVDSRLSSCVSGSNCTFSGTYTTICGWQPTSNKIIPLANSWYCSVEGGTLPQKDWFRYTQSPEQYVRRFNYLK